MLIALLVQVIKEEQYLFRRLKILQKTLDELDIEGINKLLLTHRPESEPLLEEWESIVDEYMKRTTTNNNNNENGLNKIEILLLSLLLLLLFTLIF
jgi:hypothetical protein